MFVEGLGSASVVNGVLRIETYHRNAKGEDVGSGEILIPSTRVIPILDGLQALITRIREQDAAQRAEAEAAAE